MQKREMEVGEGLDPTLWALKREKEDHELRDVCVSQKVEKARKWVLPQKLQKEQ